MKYQYIKENPIENKIDYSYSSYRGTEFLSEWSENRRRCLFDLTHAKDFKIEVDLEHFENNTSPTDQLFDEWLEIPKLLERDLDKVFLLIKRFEVVRKLYNSYDDQFRPLDKNSCFNYNLYIKFGLILSYLYKQTNRLQYLNSLIKVNDILIGIFFQNEDGIKNKIGLSTIIKNESEFIELLIDKLNIK